MPCFPAIGQTIAIKRFSGGGRPAFAILRYLKFEILTADRVIICSVSVIVPNFVALGQTISELSRSNSIQ